MSKILIVEDDRTLCEELTILLEKAGYTAENISDFTSAGQILSKTDADLILMDINLPEVSGEDLLRDFRKVSDTPVSMLTSRTGEVDELLSMSFGADHFITKPYNPAILLLRISAVLKRSAGSTDRQMYRGIAVSTVKGSLRKGDEEQILTKNEMIIFRLLLDHEGEIVSSGDLMTALWDNEEYVNENALFVNISRLRAKLAALGLPDAIETRKKQGYILK